MNGTALPDVYAARASALGTNVKFIERTEFSARLEEFLKAEVCKTVALPVGGWPEGLREEVVSVLSACGIAMVNPVESSPGRWTWDRQNFAGADVGMTFCENYLADTGSMVLSSGPGFSTVSSLLPVTHLAVSYASGAVEGLGAYLRKTGDNMPSRLTLITGPSRTGDIEASMTTCVHGPGRVHQWIIRDK